MISISMLKIYSKSIIKPLLITYKKYLEKGCFLNEWKMLLFVSIKKITKKQTVTKKLSTNISIANLR